MCINIWKQIICEYILSSIANLKCTPSDRQMYPWGYMYPRLGTPDLKYAHFDFLTEIGPKRLIFPFSC